MALAPDGLCLCVFASLREHPRSILSERMFTQRRKDAKTQRLSKFDRTVESPKMKRLPRSRLIPAASCYYSADLVQIHIDCRAAFAAHRIVSDRVHALNHIGRYIHCE